MGEQVVKGRMVDGRFLAGSARFLTRLRGGVSACVGEQRQVVKGRIVDGYIAGRVCQRFQYLKCIM